MREIKAATNSSIQNLTKLLVSKLSGLALESKYAMTDREGLTERIRETRC